MTWYGVVCHCHCSHKGEERRGEESDSCTRGLKYGSISIQQFPCDMINTDAEILGGLALLRQTHLQQGPLLVLTSLLS